MIICSTNVTFSFLFRFIHNVCRKYHFISKFDLIFEYAIIYERERYALFYHVVLVIKIRNQIYIL